MSDTVIPEGIQRRCAIYTRKSVQPPITQEVTSLAAQRQICSSYIASQAHRNWVELPKIYEDAGKSGGNLDRPALQNMLSDIEQGLVDVVLVYKLDRITRTLLDFVRLIDFFERFDVTFVSITQNFDSGDSMGRLIRNILLTFAQFEREIAADRIRDKKLVLKKAGHWTGGNAPLGYDLRRGKLVPNLHEAPIIPHIFETYVRERRLAAVHKSLLELGFRRKKWKALNGARRGGTTVSCTVLDHILSNPVYIGEVTRYGERFPGIHQPILDREIWEQAQVVLKEQRISKPRRPEHILAGIIRDAYGRPMNSRGQETSNGAGRYYMSADKAWAKCESAKPWRCHAGQAETLVMASLNQLLSDRVALRRVILSAGVVGKNTDLLVQRGGATANRLNAMSVQEKASALKILLRQVDVEPDRLLLWVRVTALLAFVSWDGVGHFRLSNGEMQRAKRLHRIDIPVHLYRERTANWLPVQPFEGSAPSPSKPLNQLLAEAREAQRLLFKHRDLSLRELAWTVGRRPTSFAKLLRLNYLAPDIVASIIDGTQPRVLDRQTLINCDLPLDWALQREMLGYPRIR